MQDLYLEILNRIGEDPKREGLLRTPARASRAMEFLTRGYKQSLEEVVNKAIFQTETKGMIILKDIEIYSLCEHHLLPFYGRCHIGYIPNVNGRVVGASKLARVVEIVARRPQLQERMTSQIADAISDGINPEGVGVVIQAEHLCLIMRGIKKPGSTVITSAVRGSFRRNSKTRAEFFSLLESK